MSTFDGNVVEFPDIQIDYFRRDPSRPAVAFFLSHVHADHLQGLDLFKGSFIYCSSATREILLRLETYPHRMNFRKGILETRVQTYKHLNSLLKPLPLETPVVVELAPGNSVRVTLFDANHCIGAVMFLIEGQGKAVLYTGDIRSEEWWVNSLVRNPVMLPFVHFPGRAPLKRLDRVYLDTTFAIKHDQYQDFPSKASGTAELLGKVAAYGPSTMFYFDSWTFGYEEVWVALASFLDSQIHLDEYRYKLYHGLATAINAQGRPPEATKLIGFNCGNHYQEGCLTPHQTRIHSCEPGSSCRIWKQESVRITPIVSRHNGMQLGERGTGKGQGDLRQQHFLELSDASVTKQLMALCSEKLASRPSVLELVNTLLQDTIDGPKKYIMLESAAFAENPSEALNPEEIDIDTVSIDKLISALAKQAAGVGLSNKPALSCNIGELPQRITFPYSRHSSYRELCLLIEALRPKDIHPCVMDEQNWHPTHSMSYLFGQLYDDAHVFSHDQTMLARHSERLRQYNNAGHKGNPDRKCRKREKGERSSGKFSPHQRRRLDDELSDAAELGDTSLSKNTSMSGVEKDSNVQSGFAEYSKPLAPGNKAFQRPIGKPGLASKSMRNGHNFERDRAALDEPLRYKEASRVRLALRQEAYDAALGKGSSWFDVGLVSVHGHQQREEEL